MVNIRGNIRTEICLEHRKFNEGGCHENFGKLAMKA